MNSFQTLITSIFLAALMVTNITAFAVSSPTVLSVKASHKVINVDNGVTISGYIAPSMIRHGENLSIKVFNPVGQLYLSDSLNLTKKLIAAGTYFYAFDFNGKPAMPGNYEIMVTYGAYDAETVVTYIKGNDDSGTYYSYFVQIANQTYPIRYRISQGSEIDFMSVTPTANLLQVGVDSVYNGTLTIEIPRSVIDAKQNGIDINYTVMMVQGRMVLSKTPAHVAQISNSFATRTSQIGLEKGTREIWIYGTQTGTQVPSQGGNMTIFSSNVLPLPLQQLRSGIPAKDVKCRNDFTLVIKAEDGSPACVKSDDITKLVQRGWAKT